jgi:hypothetical protein
MTQTASDPTRGAFIHDLHTETSQYSTRATLWSVAQWVTGIAAAAAGVFVAAKADSVSAEVLRAR